MTKTKKAIFSMCAFVAVLFAFGFFASTATANTIIGSVVSGVTLTSAGIRCENGTFHNGSCPSTVRVQAWGQFRSDHGESTVEVQVVRGSLRVATSGRVCVGTNVSVSTPWTNHGIGGTAIAIPFRAVGC